MLGWLLLSCLLLNHGGLRSSFRPPINLFVEAWGVSSDPQGNLFNPKWILLGIPLLFCRALRPRKGLGKTLGGLLLHFGLYRALAFSAFNIKRNYSVSTETVGMEACSSETWPATILTANLRMISIMLVHLFTMIIVGSCLSGNFLLREGHCCGAPNTALEWKRSICSW